MPGRPTRYWIAAAALAVFAAAWWALWPRSSAFVLEPARDQNVLLVTIDTLRADALSSYGGPAQTPHLDRLAATGARFSFAHAHAVVTLPSHTTILTGQLPYVHGMRDNSGFRVPEGTRTLATPLKAAGFATGAFVGGFPLTKRFGLTPGFDLTADLGLAGAHTIMGVILSRTGRKSEAIESWKRAVALDTSEFNALYNLWLELATAGRRHEAVEYGRQFVATAPAAFFLPPSESGSRSIWGDRRGPADGTVDEQL